MGIKSFNPTTPSRRTMTVSTFEELTRRKPEKSLTIGLNKKSGHNSYGRITSRFKGAGHKRAYRLVDFKRDKDNIPAKVAHIEYDPNRTARIALLHYADGEKRYIISPSELKAGDVVMSGENAEIKTGNVLPLRLIPDGTIVCCVELKPKGGAKMAKSAGSFAQILGKEKDKVTLRLPSGEIRLVSRDCKAMIGQVGNQDHENIHIGKAGRSRWLGKRPHNRGVVMNPVDHPMGGGEGKTSGGRHPCSPWGQLAKGKKTRKPKKQSNTFIVKRRK